MMVRLSKLDSIEVVHNQGAITAESPLDSYSFARRRSGADKLKGAMENVARPLTS